MDPPKKLKLFRTLLSLLGNCWMQDSHETFLCNLGYWSHPKRLQSLSNNFQVAFHRPFLFDLRAQFDPAKWRGKAKEHKCAQTPCLWLYCLTRCRSVCVCENMVQRCHPPPPPRTHHPMVMGQTSTPPPPCGCGPVVGLWWFRVGLGLV